MINFKIIVLATLTLFLGMLVFVTMTAFSRKSGNTGLDMAKIHLMRKPVQEKKVDAASLPNLEIK